ncbi:MULTISPECIES: putative N-acetylmannosamine-6-phosphate 2-epimerase [unclassified Paenibacillus]|uniref:N-acetylmannosamine-6-phosphate 2-epimerase n=1 Tax=unclassified Paenibacillus TaxID=185978 RepID=UPI002405877A|nr:MULTISPECIES: putative N-acetylmannosamine-6-phosphate 2-epimerase [unclassified Paenibacillus]MDF9842126.1 N-acylglucosamine-6-phosphate 2-epimerase [Paenibacillus sp. PastF-2]MDF9848620.1 N-acylglucosamine-6-phosphate 2-epimerase [Paenibacillus sp. PastM-2]MDF9855189.1 N-acylglucosamine-6-phosphate 2-epimerase [Paenibacillus sp. PastF-1]MDH6480459.1 N-acylglucosamine-6-phosphate 2-epimerase [Paenibacillus sp. PastH-2]MDH6507887.1 N-acylglucosamine-6-phosphate 2-epimerase [Paenibacillus sp
MDAGKRGQIPLHGLVVSCQALEHEPLHGSHHMAAMARAAKEAGAAGIRAGGAADIKAIKAETGLPVIGLVKKQTEGCEVYITPTLEAALDIHAAGADIVAIDGTGRPRPDGRSLQETIAGLKQAGVAVMADIATFEEGVQAAAWGADYISTTLSGYTAETAGTELPNLALLEKLAAALPVPVVAEGGISQPEQAAEALRRGAAFVVVGSAITRPQWIAGRYVEALRGASPSGGEP